MKKLLFIPLLLLLFCGIANSQTIQTPPFNFDFERLKDKMPEQWVWSISNNYAIGVDSLTAYNGKYSVYVESLTDSVSDFRTWTFGAPETYKGSRITFTGYIKTENVTDGYAGLWIRVDPNIAFGHMSDRGAVGTTDWTKYEITLDLNPRVSGQIVLGGLLSGKGKMWIDGLNVKIDSVDIEDYVPVTPPAKKDREFDNGSGISELPINTQPIEVLKELGLIWGFLKYYHPEISRGNYNWDYELFRILPQITSAKDKSSRDAIFTKWIHQLGLMTQSDTLVKPIGKVAIEPDLAWIDLSGFSPELKSILTKVKNTKREKEHYYIDLVPYIGNPDFKNEEAYSSMKYPDMGYRILSLYRYWNMIQYYFPYKDLIEEDWKGVLEEFIPRFISAKNETEYLLATLEIIARVHDTHANIWGWNQALNHYQGLRYAAPIVTFVENRAIVTGFHKEDLAEKTGLFVGDILTEIDGKEVETIINEKLKMTPASNYPTQLRDIASDLLRANADGIDVAFIRNGILTRKRLATYSNEEMDIYARYQKQDTSFRILENNIAYLYPGALKKGEILTIWERIKDTKGLIVDLRCYPSDFIVFSLGSKLVPKQTSFVTFSRGSILTPGLFTIADQVSIGNDNPDYYKGKVVILINEETQSQAEYTTMALRIAPNATVIGSTTAGADGNMSYIMLPGGIRTGISGIGVYYPDGSQTQRVGIIPDILLKPTIKGVIEGRDELLEKAISVIRK